MSRLFLISADELDESLTAFGRDRGSGTALPAADLRRGDVYFHTGLGCLMVWNGVGWRQVDVPSVANRAAITAISTTYSALLYDGFAAWVADEDTQAQWNGTGWDGLWTAYTPTWAAGTAVAIGNGTLTGRYRKIGRNIDIIISLVFGSTTNGGSGSWTFSAPFASLAGVEHQLSCKAWTAAGNFGGNAYISGGSSTVQPLLPGSGTSTIIQPVQNASAAGASGTGVPQVAGSFTFVTGHNLTIFGRYESAA